MKAIVLGYHGMGCLGLEALLAHGVEVPAVFTHRDDPGEEIWWPSLAERARARGIPVVYAGRGDEPELVETVAATAPDFLFSFYFRYLVPHRVLASARRGALNLHGSLLPHYRGRAPVNWVLVEGETETGVSLHYMVERADAGDLVDQEPVAIAPLDTAYTLYGKLEKAAVRLLDRVLPPLMDGTSRAVPLDLTAGSYRGGRTPADGEIDWSWSARRIFDLVRAVTHPYPGAFTWLEGRKVFVWWALPVERSELATPGTVLSVDSQGVVVAAGEGALLLVTLQIEGQPELPACVLGASEGLRPGDRLGAPKGGDS